MNKLCSKCKESKDISNFRKQSATKDGYKYYCKTCETPYHQQRYIRQREKILNNQKIWNHNNRDIINKYRRINNKLPINRIKKNLRKRIKELISHPYEQSKHIGCSGKFLKQYLESKFLPGMNWDNYGFGDNKWHVDHIKPLSLFNLDDKEQLMLANHYSNLQPLWQKDNLSKGNKY